jgi:glycosyltransferase involved in cell wall biosynthesis
VVDFGTEGGPQLRVILVSRGYPPDTGGGGIATYAHYLAIGLQQAGHQVKVISQMALESKSKATLDAVEVHRMRPLQLGYRYRHLPIAGRYLRFSNDLLHAWSVHQQLRWLSAEWSPDIVEYADIDAECAFHPFAISPAVVKLHTPYFYNNVQLPYDIASVSFLEKRSIMRASGLSSPSHCLTKIVADEYGLPETTVTYVPNPINTDFFLSKQQVRT